jgi:hypothetical protein
MSWFQGFNTRFEYWWAGDEEHPERHAYDFVQMDATYPHTCSACKQPTEIGSLIGIIQIEQDDGPTRHLLCEACLVILLEEQMRGNSFVQALYQVYRPLFNTRLAFYYNAANSVADTLSRLRH